MKPPRGRDILAETAAYESLLENRDHQLVLAAAQKRRKDLGDLALLLSPGADRILEELAQLAHRITLWRFGRTIQLYIPLYLSNRCAGTCPYCGFRGDQRIERGTLSLESAEREARAIADMNMRHILLVSGDDPRGVDVDFMAAVIRRLKTFMHSVSIEVPPMSLEEYRILVEAGLDGVTLYQETYDPVGYAALHADGPKEDYRDRLDALDRAGTAGVNVLTAGALWGLAPWRLETLRLGAHAAGLEHSWWRCAIQLGMPRLRQVPESFEIPNPIGDRDLTHIMVAMRIFLEDVGVVLSTRESPELRDSLVPLGVTQMSAGSVTRPGGYASNEDFGDQFEVVDHRSPAEMADVLAERGYDPVWKDWDRGFGQRGNDA